MDVFEGAQVFVEGVAEDFQHAGLLLVGLLQVLHCDRNALALALFSALFEVLYYFLRAAFLLDFLLLFLSLQRDFKLELAFGDS